MYQERLEVRWLQHRAYAADKHTGAEPSTASSTSGMTDVEGYAFDFFRRDTAGSLEVISPTRDWVQVALQMAHEFEPVFHAVTAVGSAHKALSFILDTSLTRRRMPMDQSVATKQYCKAMTSLQQYITQAMDGTATVEPVLIACVLFICYEVTVDRAGTAMSHLNIGRRIIAECLAGDSGKWRARSPSQQTVWGMASTFDGLLEMDGLRPLFRQTSAAGLPTDQRVEIEMHRFPPRFSSIEEAKASLDRLVKASTDLRSELVRLADQHIMAQYGEDMLHAMRTILSLCFSRMMDLPVGLYLTSRIDQLTEEHARWLEAVATMSDDLQPEHSRALALMQIQHFTSMFTLSTSRDREERLADRFEPDFIRTLDLCDQYVSCFSPSTPVSPRAHPDWPSLETQRHGFSLEPCILPAVYLICCKCRSSAIRRRAAKLLLNIDRREGLFWSGVLAAFGDAHIEIEERRARACLATDQNAAENQSLSAEQVAEVARFADAVVAGQDGPPPRTTVWTGRLLKDCPCGVEVVVYNGCGFPLVLEEASRAVYAITGENGRS